MDPFSNPSAVELLIERISRLERLIQDVVKDEFTRLSVNGISVQQALLLYRMGERRMTQTEMKQQGCYLGSNTSYNVKHLVEAGYLQRTQGNDDRRQVHLQATEEGRSIARIIETLFARLGEQHEVVRIKAVLHTLNELDSFLTSQIRHIY